MLVDKEQENLEKYEEESKKELEEIKSSLETKKNDIIDYIINNIMEVKMEFPEMVKKRFVKKKHTVLDSLMSYYNNGGFSHLKKGLVNQMILKL